MPEIHPRTAADGPRSTATQILAALALALPIAGVATWNALGQGAGITLADLFLAPLVGASLFVLWMLFLHRVVCADRMEVFGFRRPGVATDALLGVGLAALLLGFHVTFGATAARWLPPRPPVPQVLTLISEVARDPWLLAIWLGPVVWIGVALFEEMARAFLLRRLRLAWPGAAGTWIAILIVSVAVGFVHSYQGAAAIVSVGLQSVLLGWVYVRTGRIRALIVSHGLYDSVQIVLAVVAIRGMGQ